VGVDEIHQGDMPGQLLRCERLAALVGELKVRGVAEDV
jgi:hypothetical protein